MYRTVSALIALALLVRPVTGAPIPPDVKQAVVFVFLAGQGSEPVPNGTGFFVAVKHENDPNISSVYLVTAKHVLQDNTGQFYPAVGLRLEKVAGGTEFGRLDLKPAGDKNLFTHHDSTVDLAVVPVLPDLKKYAFKAIPEDWITTKESFKELGITEGSDIFFTGLFLPHYGQQHNYPIVRFGRVAMISEEPVPWKTAEMPTTELRQLYLIETQSYGGNSGSPVFFYLGSDRNPGTIYAGPPIIKLAGVMSGSFGEKRPIDYLQTPKVPASVANVGIAAVVPSYLLYDILFSSELKEQRRRDKPK